MKRNDVKNGKRQPVANSRRFGSLQPQPTPEAKKAGWERRRKAQEFMDIVMKYQDMSLNDFQKLSGDIQSGKSSNLTISELMAFKYVTKAFNKDKFLIDWINRHISYAPQNIEYEDKSPISSVTIKIIKPKHKEKK